MQMSDSTPAPVAAALVSPSSHHGIGVRVEGEAGSLDWRLYYTQDGRDISPWHDIPLYVAKHGDQCHMVCEIPKGTNAKFECATNEVSNPLKQDTQNGKPRFYSWGNMLFNYGFFPQTWEDPDSIPSDTGCPGDNDPVDCLELSSTPLKVGSLVSVKILGVLGLIDDGETDWKVICINVADPLADQLNDVSDVESVLPGAISAVRDWFRDYKSASGKINSYALEGRCMPRDYALNVLAETHKHWQHLHLERKQSIIGESLAQLDARRPSPAPAACISGETEQPISFHGPEDLPQ